MAAKAALENSISFGSLGSYFAAGGGDPTSSGESALDDINLEISSSRVLILSRMLCRWCWDTSTVVSWLSSDARAATVFAAW